MLDWKYHRFPVLSRILATCRKPPRLEHWKAFYSNFQPMVKVYQREGLVPEEMLARMGLPEDTGFDGQVVVRDVGIAREHMQRVKSLTHPHQVELRRQHLLEIEHAEKQKKLRAENKLQEDRTADMAIISQLSAMNGKPPSEENIKDCTLEQFARLLANQLKLFIKCRHPVYTSLSKFPSTNKGTLEEAKAGVEKLILVAYRSKDLPSKLQAAAVGNNGHAESNDTVPPLEGGRSITNVDADAVGQRARFFQVNFSLPGMPGGDYALPSSILEDDSKVQLLIATFNSGAGGMVPQDVTKDLNLQDKADTLLSSHLRPRLLKHIRLRVMNAAKHDHWCLKWAMKNLSLVAAYMILFDHIKGDISCLNEMSCLLSTSTHNFLMCTNEEANLQGCYLYFDSNDLVFVRSGKVTGRGFSKRHEEHFKSALAADNPTNSTFYDSYPSKRSVRATSPAKDGYFEYSQQFVAAGFDSTAATTFAKDFDAGGLFLYSEEERKLISQTKFYGREGDAKYSEMVAYLFEIAYDIAISPRHNKSDSPGFEACGLNL